MSDKAETMHCTTRCFKVEAHIAHGLGPQEIEGQLFDGEWRTVRFQRAPFGVPVRMFNAHAEQLGYLTYEAAMALAYWFAALAEASAVEIRLVEYEFVYDYKVVRVGEDAPIEHGGLAYHKRALGKAEDAVARGCGTGQS